MLQHESVRSITWLIPQESSQYLFGVVLDVFDHSATCRTCLCIFGRSILKWPRWWRKCWRLQRTSGQWGAVESGTAWKRLEAAATLGFFKRWGDLQDRWWRWCRFADPCGHRLKAKWEQCAIALRCKSHCSCWNHESHPNVPSLTYLERSHQTNCDFPWFVKSS